MRYLLDTNTCIRYMNGRSIAIYNKLESLPEHDVIVCSVVKGELFYGSLRSHVPEKSLADQKQFLARFVSLPFDDAAAVHYSRIRADLAAKGTPIGPNDLFIAAIAIANDVILVTHNTHEFSRVVGLRIEDWDID